MSFPLGIKYEPAEHPTKREWFRLLEPYNYGAISIPAGYEWDGATIPRFAWSIIGYYPMGKMAEPSLVHDWIYVNKGNLNGVTFTRKESDDLFYTHMIAAGVEPKAAKRMYRIVRIFGFYYWKQF